MLQRSGLEIWNRELSDGSYALAFVSHRVDGAPYAANFTYYDMELPQKSYLVTVSSFILSKKYLGILSCTVCNNFIMLSLSLTVGTKYLKLAWFMIKSW